MILSDFLSRQKHGDSNPHDIIPIPFNMHNILHKRYYNLELTDKSRGIILLEVHGMKKILDTNSPPEKQKTAPQVKKGSEIKPRLGQGRAGIKCKKPQTMKSTGRLMNCRKY